jgi:hypothetical protein
MHPEITQPRVVLALAVCRHIVAHRANKTIPPDGLIFESRQQLMPEFSHFSNREGEAVNYDSFLQTDARRSSSVEISVGGFVSLSFEELSAFEIRRPAL